MIDCEMASESSFVVLLLLFHVFLRNHNSHVDAIWLRFTRQRFAYLILNLRLCAMYLIGIATV